MREALVAVNAQRWVAPKERSAAGSYNTGEDHIGRDAPSVALCWPASHHTPTCSRMLMRERWPVLLHAKHCSSPTTALELHNFQACAVYIIP